VDGEAYKLAARFLQGMGMAEITIDEVRRRPAGLQERGKNDCLAAESTNPVDALKFLSTLSFPATRHVAFAAGDRQTAFVHNGRNGSELRIMCAAWIAFRHAWLTESHECAAAGRRLK